MRFLLSLCLLAVFAWGAVAAEMELVSVKRIWNRAPHNAFTDLIRFHDQWFCTFRESDAHVGGNGGIRVLVSTNGDVWESAALVTEPGIDLRDPKFSIAPDHRLMLAIGGSVYKGQTLIERQPRVSFSADGRGWSAPHRVLDKDEWLWRVTWHKGRAYGVSYSNPKASKDWVLKLAQGDDGQHYQTSLMDVPGRPNESTLRFDDKDTCVALVRREAADRNAWIGASVPPYTNWTWHSSSLFVGGPNFISLPDHRWVVAGRQLHPAPVGAKAFVGWMTTNSITPVLTLPSGGDCSYPGLVWHDGRLWISYYSSHEAKTSIYLAQVRINP